MMPMMSKLPYTERPGHARRKLRGVVAARVTSAVAEGPLVHVAGDQLVLPGHDGLAAGEVLHRPPPRAVVGGEHDFLVCESIRKTGDAGRRENGS